MTTIKNITGAVVAAMIGFGTLGAAQAAPLASANAAGAAIAGEAGVTEVGGRHRGRHRHGRRHRHRHNFHFGWHYRPARCYFKRVKVYDPNYDEYYYERRKVCTRHW
ncbi:MAG: hypothetical protein AAGB11_12540 [Pseudomonadota bacterium]